MRAIRMPDPEKVFFTSDTHFGHENIIRYCGRPFSGTREMNKALVDNWNKTVPVDAEVWHLGDFCMGGSSDWKYLVEHLNGNIHLVLGNHDKIASGQMLDLFASVHPGLAHVSVENNDIWLSHFPLLCFTGSSRGAWALFGHVHTQDPETDNQGSLDSPRMKHLYPTQYDVGVDQNGYRPVSYLEVKTIIEEQIKNRG